jgi:hypothetical protein
VVAIVVMIAVAVRRTVLGSEGWGISLPAAPHAPELARQEIKADKRNHRVAYGFELVRLGIYL